MYLTYTEYKTYGGELDTTEFNRLEYKARVEIDNLTFGRLKNLTTQLEQVKRCMFELIELHYKNPDSLLTSESVDGYSVTYKNSNDTTINDIIEKYLSECEINGTPYLYRGTDEN